MAAFLQSVGFRVPVEKLSETDTETEMAGTAVVAGTLLVGLAEGRKAKC